MKMKQEKRCGCGRVWDRVPRDHMVTSMGYWWNCGCRSTLFVGHKDVEGSRWTERDEANGPILTEVGPHSSGLTFNGRIVGSREGTL